MVPSAIIELANLPLTPGGKVDRKALPAPVAKVRAAESQGLLTPVGEILAGIWANVLRVEHVGPSDNFFELGGHSLLATQVISRIRDVLDLEVPLRVMFESPTVAGLAKAVERGRGQIKGARIPPVVAVAREGELPLSFAQQRLWFMYQLERGSWAYNVPAAIRVKGRLSIESVEDSVKVIEVRHETLRTRFEERGGKPRQRVDEAREGGVAIYDVEGLDEGERERVAGEIIREEARRGFDLEEGPVWRVGLVRVGESEHIVTVTMHHIISDGWSMGVLMREMERQYNGNRRGEGGLVGELRVQYGDYASWQHRWLEGEVVGEQMEYWKRQLEGGGEKLELPVDRARPAMQSYKGASYRFELGEELSCGVKRVSRRENVTVYMTMLGAYQTLMYRYTGQEDISVGTPVAGRGRVETEEMIGCFVNTLVMRVRVGSEWTFGEMMRRVREVVLEGHARQDVPFERLVEELQPERDPSHTPLFQVMFAVQNGVKEGVRLNGLVVTPVGVESGSSKFDLTLEMAEKGKRIVGRVEYNTDLFDEETIERMAGHYEVLLGGVVRDVEIKIGEMEVISEEERRQIVEEWNGEKVEQEGEECIHELMEREAEKRPDSIGVVSGEESVTYGELNRRANQLGHYLRRKGVGKERVVGVKMRRGVEMVVALLGVLKAGGAYVALDPGYPKKRLEMMLEDSGAELVVTEEGAEEEVGREGGREKERIYVDLERERIGEESEEKPESWVGGENLAYLIYTSGSTGEPKGAAIEHRSAVGMMKWARESYGEEERRGVLGSTSICFDLSVYEIFGALSWGGEVILVENALSYGELESRERVSLINTVPSAMREMVRREEIGEWVKVVNLAGEALEAGLVREIYEESGVERVVNLYGPTEDTTYTTWEEVERGAEEVTIGRPIWNTRVYILDEKMEPVSIGVRGEIYIGGEGQARGYFERREETAEKFVPDGVSGEEGGRLYRSGDIGRWRREGKIEYVGRKDGQVKVRGYRIELGEVEIELRRQGGVREAVVIARKDERGGKELVGYIVGGEGARLREEEVKRGMRERLPEYMVPGRVVVLERMPLTANGKVDRKRLPEPEREAGNRWQEEEMTPVEEVVAGIWEEVLRREGVGRRENFFEMGGHSLLATQVISRVREVLGVEVELRAMFEKPTVGGLAEEVERERREGGGIVAPAIEAVSREGELPLSFAQQRLWFIHQLEPESAAYNIPYAVRLEGELDINALRQSLTEVVRRHEVLRTRYESRGGQAVQVIEEASEVEVREWDVSELGEGEREEESREIARREGGRAFSLERGPVIRAGIVRLSREDHILVLTMHHIATDGWSTGVLMREFGSLYEGIREGAPSRLRELEVQYGDYAVWQKQWLQREVLEEQLEYWGPRLTGVTVLELPADKRRPSVASHRGGTISQKFSPVITQGLKAVSRQHGATLFITLLTTFKVLLSRYSGQQDISVGTPIANRSRKEIENNIGFFANTLVMRNDLSGNPRFTDLLMRVREVALDGYKYQDMPFEKIVENVQTERDLSHNPLFQVLLALHNLPAETTTIGSVRMSLMKPGSSTTRFDLSVDLVETQEGLVGNIEYSTDLFEESSIRRMAGHFENLIGGIILDPEQRIGLLPLMGRTEMQEMLGHCRGEQVKGWEGSEQTVHELIERRAEREGDAVAAVYQGEQVSYGELNRRGNRLGHYLRRMGVDPEKIVAVYLDRGLEAVTAMLAIMKAGGAYLPIDMSYPTSRVTYIVKDAGAGVVVTSGRLAKRLECEGVRVVCVDEQSEAIGAEREDTPGTKSDEGNLAYVIYTSGSTGRPKGVGISHRNIVHLIKTVGPEFAIEGNDVWICAHSFSFDISVWEMWTPLIEGSKVVIVPTEVTQSARGLMELMREEQVTVVHQTPTALEYLIEERKRSESVAR
jgi:amino acid adenylation domain-containing protein